MFDNNEKNSIKKSHQQQQQVRKVFKSIFFVRESKLTVGVREKNGTDVSKHNNETHLDEIIRKFSDATKMHVKTTIQEYTHISYTDCCY